MTERLHFHFSLSCIGEGNGNPLQCSCLENPRDGGAWWAAVYGVTQSRTRMKWLSSSSIYMHTLGKSETAGTGYSSKMWGSWLSASEGRGTSHILEEKVSCLGSWNHIPERKEYVISSLSMEPSIMFPLRTPHALLLLLLSRFSRVRLCDPIDGSPQTEAHQATIPGIHQARTLEWIAISLSNAWKRKVKAKSLSRVWVLATPWTAVYHML